MRSEISINLGSTDENFDVRRSHTDSGGTHWISFHREQHGNAMEFTAFGSPDELDAFIDQIAALRTKVDEPVSAAVDDPPDYGEETRRLYAEEEPS